MKRFVPFLFALLLIPVALSAITSARKPSYFQTNQLSHLNHPRYRGVVGHWMMTESGGLTAYDISGNRNHGTLTNGPTWTQGQFGPALSFDGTNDIVVNDLPVNIPAVNAAQSFSFWYQRVSGPATGHEDFLATGLDNSASLNEAGIESTLIGMYQSGGGAVITTTVPTASIWHHFVWTYDGTTNRLFIDGLQKASNTTAHQSGNSEKVILGSWSTAPVDENFQGMLDDVRIYNRALSADEVMSLYTDPFLEFRRAGMIALRKPSVLAKVKHRVTQ